MGWPWRWHTVDAWATSGGRHISAGVARRSNRRRRPDAGGALLLATLNTRMLTWSYLVAVTTLLFLATNTGAKDSWQNPGCHKVGHTRKISIPDCVEFHMTTNACRGYCESWAIPSGPKASPAQPVTSVGQCCNIMDTEPVEARVLCVDGVRTLTFKSAVSCSCYHCKKD